MNCPYCGSELDTGFNCPKCKAKSYKETVSEYNTNGEKIYEKNTVKLVQPDPTPKEMLWELVENGYCVFKQVDTHLYKICKDIAEDGYLIDNIASGYTLTEAVRAAYEKAKEKEDE